jgi:glucuronoarabinoxylan endo-1,4-beta-xylanase
VLNAATTAQPATFAVGRPGLAIPYLTDDTHDTAAQPPVPDVNGSFTTTLPARSLVTFVIG